jgi:hypothetical protein
VRRAGTFTSNTSTIAHWALTSTHTLAPPPPSLPTPRLAQILSVEDERIVGISLPDDSEVRWFTLKAGVLAYDPDTANYFALKKVRRVQRRERMWRALPAAAACRLALDCNAAAVWSECRRRWRGARASQPVPHTAHPSPCRHPRAYRPGSQVSPAEVEEWVAKAEKKVFGASKQ